MSQSNYIAAFVFLGFIVYITVKGELPAYKAAILGTSSPNTSTTATAAGS